MDANLKLEVVRADQISPNLREDIHTLCNQAYEEDLIPLFSSFKDVTHVLGYLDTSLVSHALWVTRWLQVGTNPVMRTAYIEAVVTEKEHRNRGFAAAVMKRVAEEIQDYELGALSPFCVAQSDLAGNSGMVPFLSEPKKVLCELQEMET